MKKRFILLFISLLAVSVLQVNALTFKLASLLPSGTAWNNSLNDMANEWRDISEGRIKVKIYPGGIAGGESDVIRKMRIGQIDMAILSATGLMSIVPDSFIMSMPFLLENEEELKFIIENASSLFDEAYKKEGFIVLTWSQSGWVKFFSRNKIIEPEDMMKTKFCGSVTQPELAECIKTMGMDVISIDIPDTLMGLQSGMVDTFFTAPMLAASYQWFGVANNMLDLKVAPVVGGILITERAWKKVPDKYKAELIKTINDMAQSFYSETENLEQIAIKVMLDNGLIINQPNKDTRSHWKALLGDDFSKMIGEGKLVSSETYNKVSGMLEEFRSK